MSLCLESAWNWREKQGFFERSQALRVFNGAAEGDKSSTPGLQHFAIDRYSHHYWVTQWEDTYLSREVLQRVKNQVIDFLKTKGAESIVGLMRPEKGIAAASQDWWGKVPQGKFEVQERDCRFWIQFEKTRHPGLFLDHEPLRQWLIHHARNWRVLNTFAYTGSLSVAAGIGQASSVTTLDLSRSTIQWAQENAKLNGLLSDSIRFIAGDVFEWLPRLKREKNNFDCIILDPPSFSHGKSGKFSTSKDLAELHKLAMELLSPEGVLITSINSANISWKKYEMDVCSAANLLKMRFQVLRQIDLPETFPTLFGQVRDRYLKGWILRRV